MSRQGTVAILGRPNVGKSSFFNYVTGKRISIVEDVPGVTRDRIYEEVEWSGRHFTLIDTGGLEPNTSDTILQQMKEPYVTTYTKKYRVIRNRRLKKERLFLCRETAHYLISACSLSTS